jgi:hypothetical protein
VAKAIGPGTRALAAVDDAASAAVSASDEIGRATSAVADEAFHYTTGDVAESIAQEGLRPGSYATNVGDLSPLQAQLDLALPPNRGLRDAVVRIDLNGLRSAGYDVPAFTRVGRNFNMPGGGFEVRFDYAVPPQLLEVVKP